MVSGDCTGGIAGGRGGAKTADGAEARLGVTADRFEALILRTEATARRECDCSLAGLRRETERLLGLLRAHPPPRPSMLAAASAEAGGGATVAVCAVWGEVDGGLPCGPSRAVE